MANVKGTGSASMEGKTIMLEFTERELACCIVRFSSCAGDR
jgi:hypothetical protein